MSDACSGLTDTCINGKCLCGTLSACNSTSSDKCLNGDCRCGSTPYCDTKTDRCLNGICSCGGVFGFTCAASSCCVSGSCISDPCLAVVSPCVPAVASDYCVCGSCKCGIHDSCTGDTPTCSSGECVSSGGLLTTT